MGVKRVGEESGRREWGEERQTKERRKKKEKEKREMSILDR
jgi:hypothetical protein